MITAYGLMIFFRLLTAHIIADFFLQHYSWIVGKRRGIRSPYLYYHVLTVGALTYLLLADWTQWQLPLFIMVTHFFIDWWKSSQKDTSLYFIVDQLLHLFMLFIGWGWYVGIDLSITQPIWSNSDAVAFWIVLSAYLIILRPLGFLIDKLTAKWRNELNEKTEELPGLQDAGSWIGYLERILIITFILAGQFAAIGFLIAAKSIFRFSGGVTDHPKRKHIEYILIGTLLSFTFAILLGLAAIYLLRS